jgi:hypothetical protein
LWWFILDLNIKFFRRFFRLLLLSARLCSQLFVDLFIGFYCQVTAQVLIHIQGVNMKVYRFENPCFVLRLTCAVVQLSMPFMDDRLESIWTASTLDINRYKRSSNAKSAVASTIAVPALLQAEKAGGRAVAPRPRPPRSRRGRGGR